MISRQDIQLIRSLSQKKYRDERRLFVAEGEKIILDLLSTPLTLSALYVTSEGASLLTNEALKTTGQLITRKEMERISCFRTPSGMLALFEIPASMADPLLPPEEIALVLDGIQDPGNLGTIIRLADWFGIRRVFCSENSVDLYNAKCVQATMGAIARVNVQYLSLEKLVKNAVAGEIPVFGTFMDGENIFEAELASRALIVLGSEGQGISSGLEPYLTRRISIPTYPAGNTIPESLNVGVSAAIVCAEFRRKRG